MIKHSLVLRLMTPLALMAALVAGLLMLNDHARRTVRVAQEAVLKEDQKILALTELRSVSRSLQRDALNLVVEPDAKERAGIFTRFDKRVGQFRTDMAALPAALAAVSAPEMGQYRASQIRVIRSLLDVRHAAETSRTRALDLFRHDVRPNERQASVFADDMIDRSIARDRDLRAEALATESHEMRLALAMSLALSMAVILAGMAIVVGTVLRPLADIRIAMDTLAAGNADAIIPHAARHDAIGRMARAIEVFRAAARERDALRTAADTRRQTETEQALAAAEAMRRADAETAQRVALERQRRGLLQDLAVAVEESLTEVNDKLRGSADRLSRSAHDVTRHAASANREASLTATAAEAVTTELAATSAATRQMAQGVAGLRRQAEGATAAVGDAIARSRGRRRGSRA